MTEVLLLHQGDRKRIKGQLGVTESTQFGEQAQIAGSCRGMDAQSM